NKLYEFALAATGSAWTEVKVDVLNAAGNIVFTLKSYAGQSAATGEVYLPSGGYTLRYSATTRDGSTLQPTGFTLTGMVISDPIGPMYAKPTIKQADTWGGLVVGSVPSWVWDIPFYF